TLARPDLNQAFCELPCCKEVPMRFGLQNALRRHPPRHPRRRIRVSPLVPNIGHPFALFHCDKNSSGLVQGWVTLCATERGLVQSWVTLCATERWPRVAAKH